MGSTSGVETYSSFFHRSTVRVHNYRDGCGDVASREALLEYIGILQVSRIVWD